MQCVNHPGVEVQSYCQSCGKPLCTSCVRATPQGQILCEACLAAGGADPSQAYWQAGAPPFVVSPRGAPNPSIAAVLGLIPGVGAMYNGQLFKGLIHVVIFAVLVSITENYGVFGIFIGAWVLYQSFEAFHTAKARRDGMPLPDPFGLNELGSWLNLGGPGRNPNVPPGQAPPVPPGGYGQNPATPPPPSATGVGTEPPPYTAPFTSSWSPAPGAPQQPPYSETYASPNPPPYAENYPPGSYPPGFIPPIPPMPPVPPVPPYGWRGREPVWAVVLIILGVVFLLKTMGFVGHLFHFAWPVLLIGFGVWMIIRRVGYSQGGPK
jgi:Domain of unknown function (DUF5668)